MRFPFFGTGKISCYWSHHAFQISCYRSRVDFSRPPKYPATGRGSDRLFLQNILLLVAPRLSNILLSVAGRFFGSPKISCYRSRVGQAFSPKYPAIGRTTPFKYPATGRGWGYIVRQNILLPVAGRTGFFSKISCYWSHHAFQISCYRSRVGINSPQNILLPVAQYP